MKTLRNFEVAGAIYLGDGVTEAKVGDQVKLYLDQDAVPGLPEYILGVIQHPVVKVDCGSNTSYSIEYDEADLDGFLESIRPDDITNWESVSAVDVLSEALTSALADETDARVAADALLVPKTTTINGKALSGNITLVTGDFTDATNDAVVFPNKLLKTDATGVLSLNALSIGGAGTTGRIYISDNTIPIPYVGVISNDNGGSAQVDLPVLGGTIAVTGNSAGQPDNLVAAHPVQLAIYTVASLASSYGLLPNSRAFVSDASVAATGNFGTIVTGGGANTVPVYCDGTNWRIG